MQRRARVISVIILGAVIVVGGLLLARWSGYMGGGPRRVNLLLWSGYDEPEILGAFKKKYNVEVNYKTFVGGDAMFSLLTQSKGVYDAVIVDPEYIARLHAIGRLRALDESAIDMSDYIEPFRTFNLSRINGKLYAPVVEFGALALVYNTKHITGAEVKSYDILFGSKLKGRLGVWDWYLPIMGVVSRSLGHENPYDLSDAQFAALKRRLTEFRPQVRAIHATIPEVLSALASEDTWAVPGGAGWAAAVLQQQGKPYDWAVPDEGGIMWLDTVVVPVDAPNPELGLLYLKWMTSPEAQAALSQKRAYASNVPNRKAYALMPADHKKGLKASSEDEMRAWLSRLSVRTLPVRQPEKEWQDAWEAFKAMR